MPDYAHPASAAAATHDFAHYVGQLVHWGGAEWRHVFHGGPDPGPVPVPGGGGGPVPPGPPTPPPTTSGRIFWVVDPSARDLVTDSDLAASVKASNDSLPTVQALWPHVLAWGHVGVSVSSTPAAAGYNPVHDILATLVSTLPEAPDALAYHSVDDSGRPFIRVGVKVCLDNGVPWTGPADHETWETVVDPTCVLTATDPKTGWTYALEVADPVESDSYDLDGVTLSNAVGPAWFGMGGTVFDQLGKVSKPFTMDPGGYVIVDKHDGQGPQSVFGEKFPEFRKRHVRALEAAQVTPRRRRRP